MTENVPSLFSDNPLEAAKKEYQMLEDALQNLLHASDRLFTGKAIDQINVHLSRLRALAPALSHDIRKEIAKLTDNMTKFENVLGEESAFNAYSSLMDELSILDKLLK